MSATVSDHLFLNLRLCYSFNRQSSKKYSKRSIATKLDFKSYIMENTHTTWIYIGAVGRWIYIGAVDLHRAVGRWIYIGAVGRWGSGFT